MAFDGSGATDHGITQTGLALAIAQAIGVGAAIFKGERIGGAQLPIKGNEAAGIQQDAQPLFAVNPVVVAAGRADTGIGNQVFAVNHLAAFRAFAPQAITFIGLRRWTQRRGRLTAISKPVEQRQTTILWWGPLKAHGARVDQQSPKGVTGQPAQQPPNGQKRAKRKGLLGT